jgi:hypothetical protein
MVLALVPLATSASWELGLGARGFDDGDEAFVTGIHAIAEPRLATTLSLQLGAYVRTDPDVATNLDQVLFAVAADNGVSVRRWRISVDRVAIDALIDWSILPPGDEPLWGGVRVLGGVSGRWRSDYVGKANEGYCETTCDMDPMRVNADGGHLVLGPAIGFAVEGWYRRVGLRWTGTERLAWDPHPSDTTRLVGDVSANGIAVTSSPVWSIDVVTRW